MFIQTKFFSFVIYFGVVSTFWRNILQSASEKHIQSYYTEHGVDRFSRNVGNLPNMRTYIRPNRLCIVKAVIISHFKSYVVHISLPLKYIRPVECGFALFYSCVERLIIINSLKSDIAATFFNLALLPLSVIFLRIF